MRSKAMIPFGNQYDFLFATLEDYVLREALNRFKDIVPILLKKYPEQFIK